MYTLSYCIIYVNIVLYYYIQRVQRILSVFSHGEKQQQHIPFGEDSFNQYDL